MTDEVFVTRARVLVRFEAVDETVDVGGVDVVLEPDEEAPSLHSIAESLRSLAAAMENPAVPTKPAPATDDRSWAIRGWGQLFDTIEEAWGPNGIDVFIQQSLADAPSWLITGVRDRASDTPTESGNDPVV